MPSPFGAQKPGRNLGCGTFTFAGGAAKGDDDRWLLPGRLAARGTEIDLVLTASSRDDGDRITVHATTRWTAGRST